MVCLLPYLGSQLPHQLFLLLGTQHMLLHSRICLGRTGACRLCAGCRGGLRRSLAGQGHRYSDSLLLDRSCRGGSSVRCIAVGSWRGDGRRSCSRGAGILQSKDQHLLTSRLPLLRLLGGCAGALGAIHLHGAFARRRPILPFLT